MLVKGLHEKEDEGMDQNGMEQFHHIIPWNSLVPRPDPPGNEAIHGVEPLKFTTQCSNGNEIDVYSCLDLATGE